MIAAAVEGIIGSVFIDSGLESASGVLQRLGLMPSVVIRHDHRSIPLKQDEGSMS